MMRLLILMLLVPCLGFGQGPYAPPAGQPGSTAVHKDSSVFTGWATNCTLMRGYWDIAVKDSLATHGTASAATGTADGNLVSLGDSGVATLTFAEPIHNGPGADFAVFENALNDNFLELAYVEVSDDGVNFVRFPSISLTDTTAQTGSFGPTDATNLYNLAGKYRSGFGTPFDLEELRDSSININAITHVRLVDVVGSIDPKVGTRDSQGNLVNDPYPTAFASGGFDLDAVGVIHSGEVSLHEIATSFDIYPNPATDYLIIKNLESDVALQVFDNTGRKVLEQQLFSQIENRVSLKALERGIYFLHFKFPRKSVAQRIFVQSEN